MFTELTPGVASWTVNAEWVKVKHWMKDWADTPEINRNITTENNLLLKLTTNTLRYPTENNGHSFEEHTPTM